VKRFETVKCGPECRNCDEQDRRGIAVVTQLDYFGDVYPEATSIILYQDEWIVHALDPDSTFGTSIVARYPKDKIVGFRNLPCETQLYVHHVDVPSGTET
jgi:hypothetical protein